MYRKPDKTTGGDGYTNLVLTVLALAKQDYENGAEVAMWTQYCEDHQEQIQQIHDGKTVKVLVAEVVMWVVEYIRSELYGRS